MKEKLLNLFQYPDLKIAVQGTFFLNLFSFFFLLIKWGRLPHQLPLFYSLPWGESQLGTPSQLLILPVSSLFIFGLNFFFASLILDDEPLIAKILIWMALLTSFLSTITLVKIVLLIT